MFEKKPDMSKYTGKAMELYGKGKAGLALAYATAPDHTNEFTPANIASERVLAMFSYVSILCLVPLLAPSVTGKKYRFSRFHAGQGLNLFVIELIALIALGLLGKIPVIGILFRLIKLLVNLACAGLSVKGILDVLKGKAKEIPFIGKYKLIN